MEMPRTEIDERLARAAVVLRKLRRASRKLAEFGEQLIPSPPTPPDHDEVLEDARQHPR